MQRNRAQKVVVKRECEWSRQECLEWREWIEALTAEKDEEDSGDDALTEMDSVCSGNAPPADGKL